MRKQDDKTANWRLLGDAAIISRDGCEILHIGKKPLGLLAYLALSGERISRNEAARLLWPGPDPSRSLHNLRQCLLSLRKNLGDGFEDVIEVSDEWLSLNQGGVTIDALELLQIDQRGGASADEIIALCRGQLLRGLTTGAAPFDQWVERQRERLDGVMRRVAEQALAAALRGGRKAQAAKLRTFLESRAANDMPAQQAPNYRTLSWSRLPRIARRTIRTLAALVIAVAVGFGAYEGSSDVRRLIHRWIDGPGPARIAVLPFTARNGGLEESSLAGGVTLGVNYGLYTITARELFVVSVIAEAAELSPAEQLKKARNLGVRYLISGSVELLGETVRVVARCLDASSGDIIWTERFDKPKSEAFELQDEITLDILQNLDIPVSSADEIRIDQMDDTEDLQAWLAAAKGIRHLIRVRQDDVIAAEDAYKEALRHDPHYVSALRGLAWVSFLRVRLGMTEDARADIGKALHILNDIVERRPDDGLTLSLQGAILLVAGDHDGAVAAGEKAASLLPGSADTAAVLAHTLTYVGAHERALTLIDLAMSLNSVSPPWYHFAKGRALRQAGRVDESVKVLEPFLRAPQRTLVHLVELTLSYMAAGRTKDARRLVAEIKRINPQFTAATALYPPQKDPESQQADMAYLVGAGL